MFHSGASSHHSDHADGVTPSIGLIPGFDTLYRILNGCLLKRSRLRKALLVNRLHDSEAELPLTLIAQIEDVIYLASYPIVRKPLVEGHQYLKRNS